MKRIALVAAVWLLATPYAFAQASPERLTVPFSDPNRPGTVKVNLFQGGIIVKATTGKDVIVTMTDGRELPRASAPEASGLRRLGRPAGLTVEEENNVISISAGPFGNGDLELQVPARTNLNLRAFNGRQVSVEGVQGDIEVNSMNGSVLLTDVSGAVVAHSTNGKVVANLKQVTADKPMAFTSLNGSVDVTLPSTVKANFKLRTSRGEVYTDLDLQLQAGSKPATVQNSRTKDGRYRLEIDNAIYGAVNGGGPEFELRSLNGNIYLRKGK